MFEATVLLACVAIVVTCLVYLYRTRHPAIEQNRKASGSAAAPAPPGLAEVSFQGADFNWTSNGHLSSSETLQLFKRSPWSIHLQEFQHRESSGLEACPPNLSVVDPSSKRPLQIVYNEDDEFWLNLSSSDASYQIDALGTRDVEDIIQKFFSLEASKFDSYVRKHGSPTSRS